MIAPLGTAIAMPTKTFRPICSSPRRPTPITLPASSSKGRIALRITSTTRELFSLTTLEAIA